MASTDTQIIESPLTAAKILAGVDAALTAVGASGAVTMAAFNQGRSMAITANANVALS